MEQYFVIPDTSTILYVGSVVILNEYPGIKWTVKHGWYTLGSHQYSGWYFCSIPNRQVEAFNNVNLSLITVVSSGGRPIPPSPCPPGPCPPGPCPPGPWPPCPCPPIPPGPKPPGFMYGPREAKQLAEAFITVESIKQRDELEDMYLVDGKIVRVNDVNGEVKYYEWDTSTTQWIQLPDDYLQKEDADNLYVAKADFNWEHI